MPAAIVLFVALIGPAAGADRSTGPWDVEALKAPPAATWGETKDGVREVLYGNAPLAGKPTRVFAYYARPDEAKGPGPFPAMVLLHGGGGKAFAEWARLWASRGYVALAMDLSGRGPDGKRLPDGGPDQDDGTKFRDFAPGDAKEMWTYHAVAAAVRGHSLLASRPEVDRDRIGVTGISWGGYLTCIVAGVDDRFKVAVPVYGCGFLDEDSAEGWMARFKAMGPEKARRWSDLFDPSRYLPGVTCFILFVNGTNDFAYPLGSYRKSYRLVTKAPRFLCVTVNMPHGHQQGWAPPEIGRFVDFRIGPGSPPKRIGDQAIVVIDGLTFDPLLPVRIDDPTVWGRSIEAVASSRISSPRLHYTTDTGAWQKRKWTTVDARVEGTTLKAALPEARPVSAFFTAKDQDGGVASSPHRTVPGD